jgi:hypothetical protein
MRWNSLNLGTMLAGVLLASPASAASPAVQAAETTLTFDAAAMHTQYHENLQVGDDESGYTAGFGIGASLLQPLDPRRRDGLDYYAAMAYDFHAGNIKYAGHYQSGVPADADDRTVFQRIELRMGVGVPLILGAEFIPFAAGGYQAWNRNVDGPNSYYGGEFYRSFLFGAGFKFDVPLTPTLVTSATAELLGLAGGGITGNGYDFGRGFGVTPQERFELGLDDAVTQHFHVFTRAYWEHFNYSGTRPQYYTTYYIYEPFSTTTQFGVNLGAAYSF